MIRRQMINQNRSSSSNSQICNSTKGNSSGSQYLPPISHRLESSRSRENNKICDVPKTLPDIYKNENHTPTIRKKLSIINIVANGEPKLTTNKRTIPIQLNSGISNEHNERSKPNNCKNTYKRQFSKPGFKESHYYQMTDMYKFIWLGESIANHEDSYNVIRKKLLHITNTIDKYTSLAECRDYLNSNTHEKTFLITSSFYYRYLKEIIQKRLQAIFIYVFCMKEQYDKLCAEISDQVDGVFCDVNYLCDCINKDFENCTHQSLSFLTTETDLNRLDPSFMYIQLLKETLIEQEYDKTDRWKFSRFCEQLYAKKEAKLCITQEFFYRYHEHSAIWWYTRDSFIYEILNFSLRSGEVDVILKMGFFIRDLHRKIVELYVPPKTDFTVYRGQGWSNRDFHLLHGKEGGLLSFTSFLSTSFDRDVSLFFAESATQKPETMGILFVIQVHSNLTVTAPFADLRNLSYYRQEQEILFAMNTVFRVGVIRRVREYIWEVELTLTDSVDPILQPFKNLIQEDINGLSVSQQLVYVLMLMGHHEKVEEICQKLLEDPLVKKNEREIALCYERLGTVNTDKNKISKAAKFLQDARNIRRKSQPCQDKNAAKILLQYGAFFVKIEKYQKAIDCYQKFFALQDKDTSSKPHEKAKTFNCLGLAYFNVGRYSDAMNYYGMALKIQQNSHQCDYVDLATTYENLADLYNSLQQYEKSIRYYREALQIQHHFSPSKHPGINHTKVKEHKVQEILQVWKTSLNIHEKHLETIKNSPEVSSDVLKVYRWIADESLKVGDYSKALEFYHKILNAAQCNTYFNDPCTKIAIYKSIGQTYIQLEDYRNALIFYQRILESIDNQDQWPNDELADIYSRTGDCYFHTNRSEQALVFYEKSRGIIERSKGNQKTRANIYCKRGQTLESLQKYHDATVSYRRAISIAFHYFNEDSRLSQLYETYVDELRRKYFGTKSLHTI